MRWFIPLTVASGVLGLAAALASSRASSPGTLAPPVTGRPTPTGPPLGVGGFTASRIGPAGARSGATTGLPAGAAGYRFGADCRPIVDDAARSFAWARALGRRAPAGLGPGDLVDWGLRHALGPCHPPRADLSPGERSWQFLFYRALLQGLVEAGRLNRTVGEQLLQDARRELVAQGADGSVLPRALDG